MNKVFKDKNVLIMGLGLLGGGVGTVKFFVEQGAKVTVTDKKTPKELKTSLKKIKNLPIKFILGKHRKQDFKNTDLIIKNPAVPQNSPFLEVAKRNRIPIETEATIFFKYCPSFIIGITGTKGKSTIAYLAYLFLKNKYKRVKLAGNIGISLLKDLKKLDKKTKVVLELSSFQLEHLKKSPKIALVCDIFPDHLDRYKNMNEYLRAKSAIFAYQNKNDILILNYDNKLSQKISEKAKSQIYFYSQKDISKIKNIKKAAFLKNGKIFYNNQKKPIINVSKIKYAKLTKISNILAAISLAKKLKVSSNNIQKTLIKFKGLPGRLELVKEINGVKYFNDTTATNPNATINSIKCLKSVYPKQDIILIAGGQDKGLNYQKLTKEISKNIQALILLPGTASLKIKKNLSLLILPVSSMEQAVGKAKEKAKKGDIILFSPASASFNMFKNEFDRGEKFIKAIT